MSREIFAPLVVNELYVIACEFQILGNPTDGMVNKLDFSLDENLDVHSEGLSRAIDQTLFVGTRLVNAEDEDDVRMRAAVTVYIQSECKAASDDENQIKQMVDYMRASGISIAYGHARSCIANMSAMSPVGNFLIPAIDPAALLNKLSSD
jgi:hypothetical protein